MFWPFSIYRLIYPKKRYIWAKVRILHETEKAILIDNGMKIWIPKSRRRGIVLYRRCLWPWELKPLPLQHNCP
jgi:hypothetical protein